jgi:glycosyltransferase involved in cell wall biosynthesis
MEKRMRILLANKFYRRVGGPETILFDTERELKARGHEVIPFAMSDPENVESEYSRYFVSNVDYNSKSGRSPLRLLGDAANMIYHREAAEKISGLIADSRPDIAHAHNIYHQLSPSILAALRKAGIPTVLTLHDCKLLCANMLMLRPDGVVCEKCGGRRFYHAVLNKCVKNSTASSAVCCIEESIHRLLGMYEKNVDLFISPSCFLRDKMVEYNRIPADKIQVLRNYANTDAIEPNYEPGDYGLFIGRLDRIKGLRTLLRACKRIKPFKVMIAGRGDLFDEAEKYIEENELSNVKLLGFRTGADLAELTQNARFVVVPSECYENCPMVVLEAFAAGKPVIGSRIGGIPELVRDGEDGLLFTPGDADELTDCMSKLVLSSDLCKSMGIGVRLRVTREFSMSVYIDSLTATYRGLVGCE